MLTVEQTETLQYSGNWSVSKRGVIPNILYTLDVHHQLFLNQDKCIRSNSYFNADDIDWVV